MSTEDLDRRVRLLVYERFVAESRPPSPGEIAEHLSLRPDEAEGSLRRLADDHVLVLAGGGTSIWMANPFSAIPTDFEVQADGQRWWGNCIWDALGILAMLEIDGRVATWCHDCGERLAVDVQDGDVPDRPWVAHFAVPAAGWWDDIGFT